jgi:acetylornithine deacetylase
MHVGGDLGDLALRLTEQLVAIDSVSPTLAPTGAGEERIAGVVADRLAAAGFTVHRIPTADPRRPSILAVRDGSRPGPCVVLNGHLDTVPVEGMPAPFVPRIEGSRLYGRGASDMKAGVAGLLVAAEDLAARDAPGRLVVALVADEEDGSTGAEAVLAELERIAGRPGVCLIAEPTWLDLASAHRGYEVVRVELTGRAAHSSQPDEGADVVPVVARLLAAVVTRDDELRASEADPELDRGSLMTTVVRAGSAPFTVAAHAEVLVERRTLPSEPPTAGLDEVRSLVAALGIPSSVGVEVTSVIRRSAWQAASTGASHDLAEHLSAALGGRARRGFPYWMESALWEEAGIPTVVCGPAGGGLHAVDEWVDVDQVRAYPGAVVEAVLRFAEDDRHHHERRAT